MLTMPLITHVMVVGSSYAPDLKMVRVLTLKGEKIITISTNILKRDAIETAMSAIENIKVF